MSEEKTLFCFGFGLSARTLAAALKGQGWRIIGTSRKDADFALWRAQGVEPVVFSGAAPMAPDARQALAESSHILVSVPPDEAGDPVLRFHGADIGANRKLRWLGYLSSTGVYGDHGGGWVDEDTPPNPATVRGRRRLAAEAAWQALAREGNVPVHIFRLAGIYGPGRNALESLVAGKARRIVKEGQVFSRIHVEDVAAVLMASMARPDPGRIYNVADDLPCPPQDVVVYAAELMGMPTPPPIPFEEAGLGPMAKSFYADNKRVRNDRIKDELGVRLAFPTYREGLAALLRHPQA